MINIFVYYLLLALCISCNRQEIKNNIVEIKNDENRIYCFLSDKINTDMEKDKNQEIEEIYSDYYFHSKQLKNRINIEVQILSPLRKVDLKKCSLSGTEIKNNDSWGYLTRKPKPNVLFFKRRTKILIVTGLRPTQKDIVT